MATAASVERQGPGRIVVRARAARPSLLVLAEGYTPGWKATLQAQGQPPRRLPVWRANIAFQAVMIPPGPVTVEWRYEPASFRAGLFLALAALSGLLALLISRPRGGDGPAS
jgi:uncharacterized membrane protein YfhO